MKSTPLILIADDHRDNVELLEQRLEYAGYRTAAAYDGEEALAQVRALEPDLLLLDIVMPNMDGMEALHRLRAADDHRDLPVIVLTAQAEFSDRVAGLDGGADEYLTKPIDEAELLARVKAMLRMRRALMEGRELAAENARLRAEMSGRERASDMVGVSPALAQVHGLIAKVASAPASVLITGESGSGKELVARAIHRGGVRADKPFIAVNCGALPESLLEAELFGHRRGSFTGADADRVGLFEAAHEGTLFLDEVGDVTPATQARLLRVLQEGEITRIGETAPRRVDARIIASTHRNLRAEVAEGRFREDLFFRLNVIPIQMPPLRQRQEDILPLAMHFLLRFYEALGRTDAPRLASETKRLLVDYGWPGNVRELEHEMERVATLGDDGQIIEPELLSEDVRQTGAENRALAAGEGSLKDRIAGMERQLLQQELQRWGGNQTLTARKLGITRQGLIKKLHRHGLHPTSNGARHEVVPGVRA